MILKRDFFFTHMIIWDKEKWKLAGGQRFLFNKKDVLKIKKIHI